jgi:hypothetical protein
VFRRPEKTGQIPWIVKRPLGPNSYSIGSVCSKKSAMRAITLAIGPKGIYYSKRHAAIGVFQDLPRSAKIDIAAPG